MGTCYLLPVECQSDGSWEQTASVQAAAVQSQLVTHMQLLAYTCTVLYILIHLTPYSLVTTHWSLQAHLRTKLGCHEMTESLVMTRYDWGTMLDSAW
jgi:hypothetical protein